MPKKSTNEASPVAHFEQSLQELENLVEKMEAGDLSLEQSLTAYERGIAVAEARGDIQAAREMKVFARRLRKAGFAQVAVLEGGIQAWQSADLPLVKGR